VSPRVRPSSISKMTVGAVDAYEQGYAEGENIRKEYPGVIYVLRTW